MNGRIIHRIMGIGALAVALWPASPAFAQRPHAPATAPAPIQAIEQPDIQQVKGNFQELLQRYPPSVRHVLREDPTLMTNQQFLATYPALVAFLNQHPEIPLNPTFYIGTPQEEQRSPGDRAFDMWRDFVQSLAIFAGFAMAIGLLTWLIRTFVDYRRWSRLSKVQAEVHTRLLDRFNTNEELMAYIATPAGSRFLSSAPISLDTGSASRSMGAPLSRIMLSLQAGLVLAAAGAGLILASRTVSEIEAAEPLHILGIISIALGAGFAISAAASFLISKKLGLLEPAPRQRGLELPEMPQ
ncbi:MAG TPA: hypothetical protein VN519_13625 [Bryobacteraceae bacterium]|nr:hypothetical protein [Bryobacteraceae bacterium]